MRVLLCAAFLMVSCGSNPTIEKPSPVAVDPKPNTRDGASLVVIGNGSPELRSPSVHVAQQDAQTAAENDLVRRLSTFVYALKMPDGETIEAKASRDATVKTRVDALLQKHKITDKRYFSDGSMDIIAELSVNALLSAVSNSAEKKDRSPDVELIIDARKSKAALTLLPAFQNSKGETLFTELKSPQMSLATTIDAARALAKKAPVVTISELSTEGRMLVPDADWDKLTKSGAPSIVVVFGK